MSAYALSPAFGTLSADSDRRFRRLLLVFGLPALLFGVGIPFIQVSGLLKGGGMLTPVRYAKLIEQKSAPEPETAPDTPVEKPQPKPVPKPQMTQQQKVEKARKKAEKAIASLQDSLAELRDSDLPTVNAPLTGEVLTSKSGTTPSFAASASKSSGGIGEVGVVERQSTTALGSRQAERVKSPVGAGRDASRSGLSGDVTKTGRTLEDIQLVFDRSKGALYTMYQRELRANPNARGKIVVRMTIAPTGRVTRCVLVSSEMNSPEFEKKVIARILLLDFGPKDVGDFTIDYPLYFFPQN